MNFIRKTIRVGNSAGVLLPKKLLGSEVKVIVLNRPQNIRREVLKAIEKDLADILGIYVINKKPLEIIAISNNIRKILEKKDMKIILVPLSVFKLDLKKNSKLKAKISKAEVILNASLLSNIKKELKL